MNRNVIIACDFPSKEQTLAFLENFSGEKPWVKIGMELFYAEGPAIVREIKARGYKIFLDLKLHDIPNTVKRAMSVLRALDVDMVNLHAAGTAEMMRAAVEGLTRPDGSRPILLAVTQLTSTNEEALHGELLIGASMPETVAHYAKNAKAAGLDGVVCSPLEAGPVKEACGADFLTVTPGVRFADGEKGDQKRVMTPADAIAAGSDYIVMGRPITGAADPAAAWERACREFGIHPIARALLDIGAVFLRPDEPFTWASGIHSPFYCDNRLTLTAPQARTLVEKSFEQTIRREYPDCEVLMGTATAGIAHAAITAERMGLPMGYVRGAAKDHGRGNQIEGKLEKGQKCVVIEDLISTGGSAIEAVNALREAGAEVLGIASIFTYGMKKGLDRLAEAQVKNVSLCDFDALCETAAALGKIDPADIARLKQFRDNPADESWMKGKQA